MKNLGKLNINPQKIMRDDELICIRGGYEGEVYSDNDCNAFCETSATCKRVCTNCTPLPGYVGKRTCS